ncbi:MAG: glycosyltransferase [Cyclobacteriaceae bacterium]|nr:glycosyltransferase [Cyclobacteriaceae bacterium]
MISIITPCYNLEKYIEATWHSLRTQTHTDWEWIIVDDASTDNTRTIIKNFSDKRIRLIESEHVGNLAVLRNRAAREAHGDFFAFLDGDDIMEPRKLELQLEQFTRQPRMQWNHTNVRILQDETGVLTPHSKPPGAAEFLEAEQAFAQLAFRNYVTISSVVIRKTAFFDVNGFRDEMNRCEDIDLWLRLTASGHSVGYLSEPLLQYRVRKSGLFSSKTLEYLDSNFKVYENIRKSFPEIHSKYKSVIHQYLSNNHLKIAIQMLGQKNVQFRNHFRKALQLDPSIKKSVWYLLSVVNPSILRKYLNARTH